MPNYILTGTPGAGKTAILRLLEQRGYAVVEESATDVIALEQSLGASEPWAAPRFVDKVLALQHARQQRAPAGATTFFDRSPVCTLALARFLDVPAPPELTDETRRTDIYDRTVLFVRNQGTIENTAARQISYADSLAFERLHEQTYRECGYRLIDVPAGPLPYRADVICDAVGLPGS
ncbi:putative ATPase [Antricoccus suffuscus]|uniref:Putative ATPase n=1 Tax=Antricoccus suffuscus TaxID=1629062 RepID=A0A2T1A728_9ACTN|nr:AAA family ATPase [Antricoccus suffuscus]PRZ44401.1 putative ATPase [Antricoccus suffuscus]